ncbi:MAG TPA: radical SAM family heme chaperone HemW [Methylomirabilota bacterium]|nr:radical SAM family heme chaperone HemW [Methylomirabilota bacterium]
MPTPDPGPRTPVLGIYLHIPFCLERCHFCSFNTGPYDPQAMERFLDALHREIEQYGQAAGASSIRIRSVFFGGGTPSLLSGDELAGLLDHIRKYFQFQPDAEITVECNPESVDREKFEAYRCAGVSRISLGVQSLDDGLLTRLGRLHNSSGAKSAYEAARAARFTNVNVDLIYGLPGLNLFGWERTLREVLTWQPDHLSCYGLTLDDGSLWGSRGVSGLPDEDEVVTQYWSAVRLTAEAGHEHYEISNYARPGFRSVHNQIYWRTEEYLALGPGGCGFLGSVRYSNVKPVDRYCSLLERDQSPIGQREELTASTLASDRIILGLRLQEGVPLSWIRERFGPSRDALLEAWKAQGHIVQEREIIRLTESGRLVSDSIFVEFL